MDEMNSSIAASWRRTTGVRNPGTVVLVEIVIRSCSKESYSARNTGRGLGQAERNTVVRRSLEKLSIVLWNIDNMFLNQNGVK
jgi:hypothetical protein